VGFPRRNPLPPTNLIDYDVKITDGFYDPGRCWGTLYRPHPLVFFSSPVQMENYGGGEDRLNFLKSVSQI